MHLAEYMHKRGLDDAAMAALLKTARLSVDRSTISRIRRRQARPSWPLLRRIKTVCRGAVLADDFLDLRARRR